MSACVLVSYWSLIVVCPLISLTNRVRVKNSALYFYAYPIYDVYINSHRHSKNGLLGLAGVRKNMDQISSAELMELYILLESSIDTQFQAWLTVTFGIIVVSYVSKGQLSKRIRLVVAVLYTVVIVALFARWMFDALRLLDLTNILATRGINFGPLGGLSIIAPIARIIAFVLGSVAALYFLYFYERLFREENST